LLVPSQQRARGTRVDRGQRFRAATPRKENAMTVGTILLIVLILLLIGALPSWPYSSGWGYRPTGLVGVVLIIVIILLLMGRI
jgi:hypothetical protein